MAGYLKLLFKILLSVGLLTYLILNADINQILSLLGNIWYEGRLAYILFGMCLFALAIFVFAVRLRLLLDTYHYHFSLWSLYKYYVIGLFFNNFLPTDVGGDVVRAYMITKDTNDGNVGLVSVMTERLMGMVSVLIMAMLVSLFYWDGYILSIVIGGLGFSIVIFFLFIFYPKLLSLVNPIIDRLKIFNLSGKIYEFIDVLRHNNDNKSIYFKLWFWSLVGQTLVIVMTYLLSVGLGLQISLGYLFFAVPAIFLIGTLPSINGFGFREGGYVFFLGEIGISISAALSLSFLAILVPSTFSLWGGVLFLLNKKKINLKGYKNG